MKLFQLVTSTTLIISSTSVCWASAASTPEPNPKLHKNAQTKELPAWVSNLAKNSENITITCSASGSYNKSSQLSIDVSRCQAEGEPSELRKALQGNLLNGLQYSYKKRNSNIAQSLTEFEEDFGKNIAQISYKKKINPHSPHPEQVELVSFTAEKQNTGSAINWNELGTTTEDVLFDGELKFKVLNFVGRILPITALDREALSLMFNYPHWDAVNKHIKQKLVQTLIRSEKFAPIMRNPQLTIEDMPGDSIFSYGSLHPWLSAGWAAKIAYDSLAQRYQTQQAHLADVIYVSGSDVKTRWVDSVFEGEWNHSIDSSNKSLRVEMFGVPEAGFYVVRTSGYDNALPYGYSILLVGRAYSVNGLSVSWSTHTGKSKMVETNIPSYNPEVVRKLKEVFAPNAKLGRQDIHLPNGWTTKTQHPNEPITVPGFYKPESWGWIHFDRHRLMFTVKKLYGLQAGF